jgi:hypothetical protein
VILWFKKNLYLAIGIFVLLLLISAEAGIIQRQAEKLGSLRAKLSTVEHDRDQARTDYNAKEAEARALRVSLEKALALIEVGKLSTRAAVAQLTLDLTRSTLEAKQLRNQRDEIYKTPGCDKIAELDIAAACPAAAASLRQRAAQMSAPY